MQEVEVGDANEIRNHRALAKEQLGMEIPLRSAGGSSSPNNPWPRDLETETRENAFAVQKMEKARARQPLGSVWRFLLSSFSFSIS